MDQRRQDRPFHEISPGAVIGQLLVALGLNSSATGLSPKLDLDDAVLVDPEGIAVWILVGTVLFGPNLTTLAEVKRRAAGAVAVLAMVRTRGNLTRASKSLSVSRRCLRETLKAAGRYPWSTVVATVDANNLGVPSEAERSTGTSIP